MEVMVLWFQAFVLVMAVAIDAFACGFGYGASKIKIPFKSVMIINLTSTVLLGIGMFLGAVMSGFLTETVASWIAFTILSVIGLIKIFDSVIKRQIRKGKAIQKDFQFKFLSLSLIFKLYADPEKADFDTSKELSVKESVPLAVALGLDGLSIGIGIGIAMLNPWLILGMSLISDAVALVVGCYLGRKLTKNLKFDLSWVAGVILVAIAISEVAF